MRQITQRFLMTLMLLTCAIHVDAATQFDFLLSQVRTSAGGALVSGKVYFYAPGTTTPKNVYLDRNQASLANNPYTLDANATAQVYGAGSYRIIIKDSAGVIKYDRDNITAAGDDGTLNAIDATSGNQTFILPAGGVVTVCKSDATANTVTITPSVGGQTMLYDPLAVQGACLRLGLSSATWYKE